MAAAPEAEELLPAAPEAEELLPAGHGLTLRAAQPGAVYVSVLTFPWQLSQHSLLPPVCLHHPLLLLLLQANVVCVVYDVTKEATIDKVMGSQHWGFRAALWCGHVPMAPSSVGLWVGDSRKQKLSPAQGCSLTTGQQACCSLVLASSIPGFALPAGVREFQGADGCRALFLPACLPGSCLSLPRLC